MREQERIRSLSSKSDLVCGNIAIGGSSFFFDSVILNTIISLQSRYPELIITAKENDTINLFPMVRDKKINIGVVLYSHVDKEAYEEKIRYYRLNSTEVLEDDMIFLVGKNHPLASRGEVPLKEILKYPLALKKSPFQELALAMFQKTNADCDVLFLDDYSSLWKIAAIANKTILSPYIIYKNEKAEDKNLAAVRIADLEYKYSLCFVHNESEYSVAEKSVVEEMRQQCILMNRQ